MHAPPCYPGGIADTWSVVPEITVFQRLDAVDFPLGFDKELFSTTIGISGLISAAYVLAPLGSAPRLTTTHASFAAGLLTRLWPGGTRETPSPTG